MPHLVCTALFKVEVRQRMEKVFLIRTEKLYYSQNCRTNSRSTKQNQFFIDNRHGSSSKRRRYIVFFWKGLFPSWSFWYAIINLNKGLTTNKTMTDGGEFLTKKGLPYHDIFTNCVFCLSMKKLPAATKNRNGNM